MAGKKKASIYDEYTESRHSGKGILATALGALSLIMFAGLSVAAAYLGGGGAWLGSIGFTAFSVAFVGMVIGLNSFHDHCKSYIFSKVGTLLCGFSVAVWFIIFCVGLALLV